MEIVDRANTRRSGISDEKGPEYAGSDTNYRDDDADVLANFKRQGRRFNVSPLLAAGLYAGKHIDSFETTVRAIEQCLADDDLAGAYEIVKRGEGFVSRLDDLRNYCDLLECILFELGIHPDNPSMGTPSELRELVEKAIFTEEEAEEVLQLRLEATIKAEDIPSTAKLMDVPSDPTSEVRCRVPSFKGRDACEECAKEGRCMSDRY